MKINEFFHNFMHKRLFRWYILAGVSFVVNITFAVYNLAVGIAFSLVWNFSVSFYYLSLTSIKGIILYSERKWRSLPKEKRNVNRTTLFSVEAVFLLLIDLALIAPILLMILGEKRAVDMGTIPTITMAAYTTYKITIACINYTRSKKTNNLALYGLKIINLKEAIVSVVTLQNTMVAVFGDAKEMWTLTTWTSGGMFACILALSIYQLVQLRCHKDTPTRKE